MAASVTQNRKVHSANRIRFTIANMPQGEVGLGQNVRINTDPQLQDASGIGDNIVVEWVPGQYRVRVTVGLMALRKKNLLKHGIIPRSGRDCLLGYEFDIVIEDHSEGVQNLRRVHGCTYAGGDLDIQKHAIVGENITFFGRDTDGDMTA